MNRFKEMWLSDRIKEIDKEFLEDRHYTSQADVIKAMKEMSSRFTALIFTD